MPVTVLPPNSTTFPRFASYAIVCPERGDGDTAGDLFIQVVPSHSQVSSSSGEMVVISFLIPPNSTTRPRAASYAIAA
jgi:hypothetical protein